MRRRYGFVLALTLIGCEPVTPASTVEALTADPKRLKEMQRQCRLDRQKAGEAVCNAVSEAYRRRFMGERTNKAPPQSD